jgi:hypothetical protein
MDDPYSEIWRRSITGRNVEKSDWDMEHIVLPAKRLVGEYELTWNKQKTMSFC